jgi:hypothetical protein
MVPYSRYIIPSFLAASVAVALGACGQTATVSSTARSIPAGCHPPPKYQFTDGAAQLDITGPGKRAQSTQMTGLVNQEYSLALSNQRYAATEYNGQPWLNIDFGTLGHGVMVEVFGTNPCSGPLDSYHTAVDVLFARDSSNRYGGDCVVTVHAFNDAGIRGSLSCPSLPRFGIAQNRPTIAVTGTFAAVGHPVT